MSLVKANLSGLPTSQFVAHLTVKQVRIFVQLLTAGFFFLQISLAYLTQYTGLYTAALLQLIMFLMVPSRAPFRSIRRSAMLVVKLLFGWIGSLVSGYLLLDFFLSPPTLSEGNYLLGNFIFILWFPFNGFLLMSIARKNMIVLEQKKLAHVSKIVQIFSLLFLANIVGGLLNNNFILDTFLHIILNSIAILTAIFMAIDAYWKIMEREKSCM